MRKKNEETVTITERDVKIIQKIHAAGWLTTQQIRDYFFPGRSTNAVCKRLRKLAQSGHIAIARAGSTELGLYRLAGQGKRVLIEHTLCAETDISIPTQIPRKLKHFIAVNDLRFRFEQLSETSGMELHFFFSERELGRYYEHPHLLSDSTIALLRRYKIIPDALAKVSICCEGEQRELILALEYDAGTENTTFFGRTKINHYSALFLHNHEHLGDIHVLTFTPSLRRLVSLMRQTMLYKPPRHLFYFALLEKLERSQWAESDIFLDPFDFFVLVQRGKCIEVYERGIHHGAIPQQALVTLPASSPRRVSPREESEESISHTYFSSYSQDDIPVI